MPEIQNRTLICSVLFVDIVEYSRKPVVEQLHLKDRFNELLTEALREVAPKDRIILDTGDGAACTFTGDPEDALFVAARLQEAIARDGDINMSQLASRMGINLGPVRLTRDINGQPNVIGDGINVAQRIMNFAQPGQVLVSHSYYEAVSRLSGESSNLFKYEGARTDKHIRDHEVYALCLTAAAEQQRSNDKRRASERDSTVRTTFGRAADAWARMHEVFRSKPHWVFSLGLIVAVLINVAYRAYSTTDMFPALAETTPAAPMPLQASVKLAKLEPTAAAPQITATEAPPAQAAPAEVQPPQAAPAQDAIVQPAATEAPAPAAQPEAAPPARVQEKRAAPKKEAAVRHDAKKQTALEAAVLDLAIAPWGTLVVDGKDQGASPPLREVKLPQGKHKIEVKNGEFPTYVVMVDAKSGERIRIKHKFR